jgi:hypothetical protein
MSPELTAVMQALLALAAAVISAAIPILVPRILNWLHIKETAERNALIQGAAQRGAGLAYQYMVERLAGVNNGVVAQNAVEAGKQYLAQAVPEALKETGCFDQVKLTKMIQAQLGLLLAQDPTVSVGDKPQAAPAADPLVAKPPV